MTAAGAVTDDRLADVGTHASTFWRTALALLSVALGALPATFSSLVIFLEAIAAAAFGWMLLGEALGWAQTLGGLFILAGIWVARPRATAPAVGSAL
jgi:drug/metabolite transporter (DMT)-like permease